MFSLLMVIIGYAGMGRAADLVPSGQVVKLSGVLCWWRGGFGIAHDWCGAGAGLETHAGL